MKQYNNMEQFSSCGGHARVFHPPCIPSLYIGTACMSTNKVYHNVIFIRAKSFR